MDLPGIDEPVDFAKVSACEAVLDLAQAGAGVTVADVAREMTLEHSTASRLLAEAERDGLLRKTRGPTDARTRAIVLTTKGEQVAHTARLLRIELLRLLLADWNENDVTAFDRLLHRFSTSLGEVLTELATNQNSEIAVQARSQVTQHLACPPQE